MVEDDEDEKDNDDREAIDDFDMRPENNEQYNIIESGLYQGDLDANLLMHGSNNNLSDDKSSRK